MRSWYVRRVEGFLKARRPASLSQVTAVEIAGYLQEVSAQAQLADWQCRQRIDALQLLFVDLAQCPAGKAIDWDWWKAGGRPLESDHPTVARSQPPAAGLRRVPRSPTQPSGFRSRRPWPGPSGRCSIPSVPSSPTSIGATGFWPSAARRRRSVWGVEVVRRFLTHLVVDRSAAPRWYQTQGARLKGLWPSGSRPGPRPDNRGVATDTCRKGALEGETTGQDEGPKPQ